MTRKKVKLAYIVNHAERKASYRKRKKGLIKKVSELSTLCGVDACAIIYSPYDPEPEVWPSTLAVQSTLAKFSKHSDINKNRKMVDQESFTRQRIKKVSEQLNKLRTENNRRELKQFMFRCITGHASIIDFDPANLPEMQIVINQTMREIRARLAAFAAQKQAAPPQMPLQFLPPQMQMPPLLAAPPPPTVEEGPAPMEEDGMDSFPWNLLQIPSQMPPPPEMVEEVPEDMESFRWNLEQMSLQNLLQMPPPPPPPHPSVVEEVPEGMESFPWNLVQSPTDGGGMESSGLGWDTGMVLPYPHYFN